MLFIYSANFKHNCPCLLFILIDFLFMLETEIILQEKKRLYPSQVLWIPEKKGIDGKIKQIWKG